MQRYNLKIKQPFFTGIILTAMLFYFGNCNEIPVPENVKAAKVVSKETPGVTARQPCIALLPFEKFSDIDTARLRNAIALFYHTEAIWQPSCPLPAAAWYEPRQRYKADTIIDYLQEKASFNMKTLVGFTNKDISTTKDENPDYGIFGLGFMPGKGCIISTYRLKKGAKNAEHLYQRTLKVVLHEIGHNYGLDHCTSGYSCLMKDAAGTIKTVDEERMELCESCLKKLNMK